MKWYISIILAVFLCVPLLCSPVFAYEPEEPDEPEAVQLTGQTDDEVSEMPEVPENTENPPELSGNEIAEENPGVLGDPYTWPEWLGEESEYTVSTAFEYVDGEENAVQLARIEYHLSIISGGVILAVCSLFTWFMIIKPLKSFIVF